MTDNLVSVYGMIKWLKATEKQIDKYGKVTVAFYPDSESRKTLRDLKLRSPLKEDMDGEFYYNLGKKFEDPRAPGPIRVFYRKEAYTKPVGNGSTAELVLEKYSWDNEFGKGNGVKVLEVHVNDLIVYEKPQLVTTGTDLPV